MATPRDREYWASKERGIRYETIEIYSSVMGLERYVLKQFSDKQFTLESTAPRNPSETVTFNPLAGTLGGFSFATDDITRTLTLGRVGTDIRKRLYQFTNKWIDPVQVLVRVYHEDDLTAPDGGALTYYVKSINTTVDASSITLTTQRPFNQGVARVYREDKQTGLQGFI